MANDGSYLFSATFYHLKNAEQQVGCFLAHPNVLLKGFQGTASVP